MTQRQEQSKFMRMLPLLILYAYELGYELTPGDTYPGKFKHKKSGFHPKGLAIDLNLFKDGVYLEETKDHLPLGLFWESIGGSWGGRWEDGNHYSLGERR